MNDTDTSTPPSEEVERRSWLAACLAPNTSRRDVHNSRRFAAWMIAWALSTMLPSLLRVPKGEATPMAVALALLTFGLFVGAAWSMVRFVRETDELNRLIQLRSIAVAFTAGLATVIGGELLVDLGVVAAVGLDTVATVMIVVGGLSQLAWTASYR